MSTAGLRIDHVTVIDPHDGTHTPDRSTASTAWCDPAGTTPATTWTSSSPTSKPATATSADTEPAKDPS
jgi:hypothetical protein